jgi:curved DNA-binding protein CbpA
LRNGRFIDYYKVLQVDPEADRDVIEAAFRRLARKVHPDTNPSADAEEKMKMLSEAYGVLSDPEKRARFDALRRSMPPDGFPYPGRAPAGGGYTQGRGRELFKMILLRAAVMILVIAALRINPRLGIIVAGAVLLWWFFGRRR